VICRDGRYSRDHPKICEVVEQDGEDQWHPHPTDFLGGAKSVGSLQHITMLNLICATTQRFGNQDSLLVAAVSRFPHHGEQS
jgi:hypothetical protein